MKMFLEFAGVFVAGFMVCWFCAADLKNDIAQLRTDIQTGMINAAKKL